MKDFRLPKWVVVAVAATVLVPLVADWLAVVLAGLALLVRISWGQALIL